ncbi:MAG: dephospho-CoA kinase [Anaerolineae bacterium]|nr:dephospho-CoA kinase [Anaerolineae bacterium]
MTEPSGAAAPYKIGLTGNIATGKSTVGKMLRALGAAVIDADKVAHRVMAPGGRAYAAVVDAFGPEIVAGGGEIDRQALGQIVFSDPDALRQLESLVHPAVIAEVDQWMASSEAPVVVVEAIKLLESGMAETYGAIWVTTCSETTQLERLMASRGMSRDEALVRIHAQPPQAEKLAHADVVIDTEGTFAATRRQVAGAWRRIDPGPAASR